jgi:hypothetical protein
LEKAIYIMSLNLIQVGFSFELGRVNPRGEGKQKGTQLMSNNIIPGGSEISREEGSWRGGGWRGRWGMHIHATAWLKALAPASLIKLIGADTPTHANTNNVLSTFGEEEGLRF